MKRCKSLQRLYLNLASELIPDLEFEKKLWDFHYHAPKYHQHSINLHTLLVIEAAVKIEEVLGVKIGDIALYHDVGKLLIISRYIEEDMEMFKNKISFKSNIFIGHEKESYDFVEKKGIITNQDKLFAILHHDWLYRYPAEKVIEKINFEKNTFYKLKLLITLCAADTAGKGFTKKQREERSMIASKFRFIIGSLPELNISKMLEEILLQAILDW